MKKIIVLGAGLIGKVIALDLSKSFDVTSADANQEALNYLFHKHNLKTLKADFTDTETLKQIISNFDLVVCAVPGFMGFQTLKTIIESGKNVVDISFFPENALDLQQLAVQNKVTAIVDCGVAPGLCNLIAGYHDAQSPLKFYECLVGGLPLVREWPYEYKAVFSPIDVIEEYTRPARFIENGEMITKEALTDSELLYFDKVGTLESFNTDGLRSLMFTMKHVPNMKEKTLRFPNHIQLMKIFRESGFFSKEPIFVNGNEVIPLDITAKLLFPQWKMKENERDFTVMRVTVKNNKSGFIYDLYDEKDVETGFTSMARTTGFTCTAAVNLINDKIFSEKGVFPPELVGKNESSFNYIIKYLKNRNIELKVTKI